MADGRSRVWQYNRVFVMGEIGTDENFGDKTGGDRPREHCTMMFHAIYMYMSISITHS